ncbi:DUF342 domain-containing protein [Shewanella colwelliana]|uniref:Flagellar Assembly Protein A N-terminal region domain-containing protein n=1 Tax=Shewanella colwelliana TaxID=23 RepID=A0ABQ4NUG1_SHECO|nr:FapA family protein [Shewanella colwelliana]GIU35305.1 hypothetical protein TUM3794_02780 [Shewanella colwelliana]
MLDPGLIELSSDGNLAEFKVIPNTHGPLTVDAITELLSLPELCQLFPRQNVIDKAVIQVNQLIGQDDGQYEQFFEIAERRDGEITLTIAEDNMSAEMSLSAPWGGKAVTLPDILKALKANGIALGLSKLKIQSLLKQLETLEPGQTSSDTIAHGKPAINGTNAFIDRKVPLARERLLQPQERADGTVDMRNLGEIIMVKPNDTLMVKIPATEGVQGYDVKGSALLPVPGKDIKMTAGTGTALLDSDANTLIATVSGQPVETKTGMQVDDVLQIKDVDVGYGNVDFKGSILITGDVHEGMVVKTTGDITVMGFVDSAHLIADGDITVSKGVIGRQLKDDQLSTTLEAKGQISAQFVQYSNLKAEGDILVTKQLLHSHSDTNTTLTVSDANGRRGDLVGGIAKAAKGIKAVIIGATAGTKTDIYCAMHHGELKETMKQLDQSVKLMVVAKLNIEASLNKLPPKSEWQDDELMVEQVKGMLEEKRRINTERSREELEFNTIKQEVDDYYQHYRIEACKHIFANVEIHIGPAFNRTQREHGPCMVFNEGQEISFDYSNRK